MLEMKKTLGVLFAVLLLLSATAATVSAVAYETSDGYGSSGSGYVSPYSPVIHYIDFGGPFGGPFFRAQLR